MATAHRATLVDRRKKGNVSDSCAVTIGGTITITASFRAVYTGKNRSKLILRPIELAENISNEYVSSAINVVLRPLTTHQLLKQRRFGGDLRCRCPGYYRSCDISSAVISSVSSVSDQQVKKSPEGAGSVNRRSSAHTEKKSQSPTIRPNVKRVNVIGPIGYPCYTAVHQRIARKPVLRSDKLCLETMANLYDCH